MTRAARWVLVVLAVAFAGGVGTSAEELAAAVDPLRVVAEIDASTLDFERAVEVKGLRLAASAARILLYEGVVVPASPIAGRPAEMVFLGRGEISLSSPDPIEAGQLELFAGAEELSESFDTAVLVVAIDRAAEVLLARPKATDLTAADADRARQLFLSWRGGAVRELLDVDRVLVADAIGDPSATTYFASLIHGEELGDFVFVFDPSAREQVTLGAFTPVELDEKVRNKVARRLDQEQRRGRLIGVRVESLGQWDTWVSESMRDTAGRPAPGGPAFVPQHYHLAVTVPRRDVDVEVEAHIRLVATAGGRRVLPLASGSRKQSASELHEANVHLNGRLFLKGDNDEFELELEFEPREVWFDPDGVVFCRFFNRERYPKRGHVVRAYEEQAAGRPEAAEASFRTALATAARGGSLTEGLDDADLEREGAVVDGFAHLGLARLLLDRGDLNGAVLELETCRRTADRRQRWLLERELAILESRAEILRGDYEPAFKRLKRGLLRREELDDTEAFLLLAIAAKRTGHPKELARALEAVKDRGVDVAILGT